MRIELSDWNGQWYSITSSNMQTIGAWFAEHAQKLLTADAALIGATRIMIYPSTQDEAMLTPHGAMEYAFTYEGLEQLATQFMDVARKLEEKDR